MWLQEKGNHEYGRSFKTASRNNAMSPLISTL